jgi:hypothetical protein
MLKLDDHKVIFVAVGLIGVLVFASPTLGLVLRLPGGERFSELWILGPGHLVENYPYNVKEGENYLVYVGVGNQMGSSAYYVCYVKLRNQTEPLPNATSATPSPLSPLYEYQVFLQDGKSWEASLSFSFENVSFSSDQSFVGSITINGVGSSLGKRALWDAENKGYFYELFVELWIYSVESGSTQFHNRFVHFWLNMTRNT